MPRRWNTSDCFAIACSADASRSEHRPCNAAGVNDSTPPVEQVIGSSDGVRIALIHLGGRGPKLLLAHATGFCATVWRPVAEALANDFDCWALDFRGHGRSNGPQDGRYDWHGTADDVLASIDAVAPDGPWLGAGHSMGGAAILLAEQARPGTFEALWMYEPIVMSPEIAGAVPAASEGSGSNFLAAMASRRRAVFASLDIAASNYASKPPMNVFTPEALAGYLERGLEPVDPAVPEGEVRLTCRPADEAQIYTMGGQHSAWAHLAEVGCPCTVVRGAPSSGPPAGFADGIVTAIPGATLETHGLLGHFGPMESPEEMATSIRNAFRGHTVT